jgi:hypothetical protein
MFGLLVWNRIPPWIVFVGTLAVTMTLRLASPNELLEGFANTSVAPVRVIFPVAAAWWRMRLPMAACRASSRSMFLIQLGLDCR